MLALIAVAELLGMGVWFAANAVAESIGHRWHVAAGTASAWLMTAVQLGFVTGTATAALLNLADIIPTKRYFATAVTLAAAANAAFLASSGVVSGLVTRFMAGFFLAGVYPPAMKMAATWFRDRRGLAIGTVVGALTVGKAIPLLVLAIASSDGMVALDGRVDAQIARVIGYASLGATTAAVLILAAYDDGPYAFPPRAFSWGLVANVARESRWRLTTTGYLGHMWELYAFWTWIPAFIAASLSADTDGTRTTAVSTRAALLSFTAIAVGAFGCVWGGFTGDRSGRERVVILAMIASGSCALLAPFVFGQNTWILGLLAASWGFFVIADSAQFSALVTESVPPHAVGTALTLQTSLGVLLTTVSIQLVSPLVDVAGWRWAFPMLALGPLVGVAAIRRLSKLKKIGSSVIPAS